jgi:hypothetical protein
MKIEKLIFTNEQWEILEEKKCEANGVNIVFVFGDIDIVQQVDHNKILKKLYPNAEIVICSTAGNILDTSIDAYGAVASAISFDSAFVQTSAKHLNLNTPTQDIKELIHSLDKKELQHILLFTPGLNNAPEILNEINLENNITISGGLAADNYKFEQTYLCLNNIKGEDVAIAIGLYGSSIDVQVSAETGWQEFGAKRIVTKSEKNIIYEIDNKPAIELYKRYLGNEIKNLPNSALRFSLSVRKRANDKNKVIRTIIHVNEDNSLVYAGNIEEGSVVQLMKTNIPNVLDGAFLSAKKIRPLNSKPSLALLISCCARRSVLKQFAEEEIEIIQDILTSTTQIIGFYSYGEIAPFSNDLTNSFLHNQTMTITAIYEK